MKAWPAASVGSRAWQVGRAAALVIVVACAGLFATGLVLWARQTGLAAEQWAFPATWSGDDLRRVTSEAGIPVTSLRAGYMLLEVLVASTAVGVALLLLRERPSWFRMYAAVALSLWACLGGAMAAVFSESGAAGATELQGIGWVAVFTIAYLFPDGRFVPRWTRWLLICWVGYIPALGVASLLGYESNPESLVEVLPVLALLGTAVYAAVHRYRKVSTPDERRQTRGLITAISLWLTVATISVATPLRALMREETVEGLLANVFTHTASYLTAALIPASIGIAMLRHRLYELDAWVNRALTAAVLTTAIAVIYAAGSALGGVAWGGNTLAGPLTAVVVIAVVLHPLRIRVQRRVNRFVFGHSLDPKALLEDLRRSRARILVAREDERQRLQRDLHDGLGPTLASLYQRGDVARSLVGDDPRAAERLLTDVGSQTRAVIDEIRGLVQMLRPPELDQLGLVGSVESVATRFDCPEISVTGKVGSLPFIVELAAYRIATEALTNAVRHAQARRIRIELCLQADAVVVRVVDDGQGIDSGQMPGTGLRSMRERADELGGTCDIRLLDGGGTEVRAVLPTGAVA